MTNNLLLVGNWKMNLGPTAAARFARELRETLPPLTGTKVWVTPATLSVGAVAAELRGSPIAYGTQNVHWEQSGAYTGETSPEFLADLGATFTLVGHSERRSYFGETSQDVAKRCGGALKAGLTCIVCIGETEAERVSGRTEPVLKEQLDAVLTTVLADQAARVVIAYEPVWAIGTGRVASLEEISSAHRYIQSEWRGYFPNTPCVILYGGSVNPANFAEIAALPEVNGALVGGASIKREQWLELVGIAESR